MIKRGGFNEKQAVYRGTVNGLKYLLHWEEMVRKIR